MSSGAPGGGISARMPKKARPQPSLQRSQALPLEPIGRESCAVTLADRLAEKTLAPVLIVAVRAAEIHLPDAVVRRTRGRARTCRAGPSMLTASGTPRLIRDERGESEEVVRFAPMRAPAAVARQSTMRASRSITAPAPASNFGYRAATPRIDVGAPWHDAQLLPNFRPQRSTASRRARPTACRDLPARPPASARTSAPANVMPERNGEAAARGPERQRWPRSTRRSRQASATSDDGHGGALISSNAAVVDPFERKRSRFAGGDEESQVRIRGDP